MSPLSAKSLISKMNKKQKSPRKSRFNRRKLNIENTMLPHPNRSRSEAHANQDIRFEGFKGRLTNFNSQENQKVGSEKVRSLKTLQNRSVNRSTYQPIPPAKISAMVMADHKMKLERLQLRYEKLLEQK